MSGRKTCDFCGDPESALMCAAANGFMPHACVLSCPDGERARSAGRRAAALYCETSLEHIDSFPDYIELDAHKLPIKSLRAILDDLARRSFEGGRRAVLISRAERLTEQAQNTLLKTLEEPPEDTVLILIGNETALLPTVRSRCTLIRLGIESDGAITDRLVTLGATASDARLYAAISGGSFSRARKLFEDEDERALRALSLDALSALLEGRLPFASSKGLCLDRGGAAAVSYMLSYTRDLLLLNETGELRENIDRERELRGFSSRFTSGAMRCIIRLLVQSLPRFATNASQAATFDRLFIEISEVTA